jgi:hypothetical protein
MLDENVRRLRRPEKDMAAPGRRWTTNWPAELSFNTGRPPCVVMDISSWGAKLRIGYLPPEVVRVSVIVENIGTLDADIVWRHEGTIGLQFHEQQAWIRRLHARRLDPATDPSSARPVSPG